MARVSDFVFPLIVIFGIGLITGLIFASFDGAWVGQEVADKLCVKLYGNNTIYKDTSFPISSEFVCVMIPSKSIKAIEIQKDVIRLE